MRKFGLIGATGRAVLLVVLAIMLVAVPVLAYSYYATIQVTETGGDDYDQLPISDNINNYYLAQNDYISDNALDTQVLEGATQLQHLVASDRLLFVSGSIAAGSQHNYMYTMGNTLGSDFPIIMGNGGYFAINDAAVLESSDNFSVEQKGWLDTTLIAPVSAGFPMVSASNTSNSGAGTSHTVYLPSGIVAGDLLLVFFATPSTPTSITYPSGWVEFFTSVLGTPTLSTAFRIANGAEGNTITVTTGGAVSSSHQSFRVANYQGQPIAGVPAYGAPAVNPDPPSLAPQWGAVNSLWFALCCDSVNVTGYPADYSSGAVNGTVPYLASAQRALAAASENPGVFTAANGNWVANTVCVEVLSTLSGEGFPNVVGSNNSTSASGTNHAVSLPTTIVSGDALLVLFSSTAGVDAPTITFPAGWTKLSSASNGLNNAFAVGFKVADGTEGATITVTTSNAQTASHQSFQFSNYFGVPQVSIPTIGAGTVNPAPISLSPSWGSMDTLWLVACCDNVTVTAYPPDYTNGVSTGTTPYLASARRQLQASAIEPGTFTAIGGNWIAYTVAIQADSGQNLVYKRYAYQTYISGTDNITSQILGGFPVVEATNGGENTSRSSHIVSLPVGIENGDLLLIAFGTYSALRTITWPAGWNQLFEGMISPGGGNWRYLSAAYRFADGSEGAYTLVTSSVAVFSSYQTYRISGFRGVPQAGTAATGNSANPDPPNLAPTWGAANNLWIAMCADGQNVTGCPTNYSDNFTTGTIPFVSSARRNLNAASENPGTFIALTEWWVANTVAVAPGDSPQTSVTATAVTSAEHTITTTQSNINNPGFEVGNPPPDWTATSCTIAQSNAQAHSGTFSMKETANSGGAWGVADYYLSNPTLLRNKTITFGAWVWNSSTNSSSQRLKIIDSGGASQTAALAKNDAWTWYTISRTINAAATYVVIEGVVCNGADLNDYMYVDDVENWILTISVDGVAQDANRGAVLPDNNIRWFADKDTMEYMEYHKHYVGEAGALIAWYQPNTMVLGQTYSTGTALFVNSSTAVTGIGTSWTSNLAGGLIWLNADKVWSVVSSIIDATHLTLTIAYAGAGGSGAYTMAPRLIDRQGASQDGAIVWGANPSGLTLSTSGLVSSSQPTPSGGAIPPPEDVVPEIEQPGWFQTPTGTDLTSEIFFPYVSWLSTAVPTITGGPGFTPYQIYLIIAISIWFFVVGIAAWKIPHMFFAGIMSMFIAGFFVSYHHLFPWWVLIISGFFLFATIIFERKPVV